MTKRKPAGGAPRSEVRDRARPLKVWVTPRERTEIERRAELAGHSLSSYLRAAGMNHPIRSTLDYQAVRDLVGVAGDLHRLHGAFMQCLAEPQRSPVVAVEATQAVKQARTLMDEIRMRLGSVGGTSRRSPY